MRTVWRSAMYVTLAGLLILAAGCLPTLPSRTNSNGDSGTLGSTLGKVLSDDWGGLNSAEWQILTEDLPTIASMAGVPLPLPPGAALPTLTDEQAEALEQFLDVNNVNTSADLSELAAQIEAGTVEVPPELVELGEELFGQFS